MKILLLIVMLIGGSYLLAEDGSSLTSPKPKTPEYLCQRWVHSFEEQQQADKDSIYRPKDFKEFPGSRFRMQYIFYKNGDCEWYYLSPDDAHHFKSGKWRFDPRKSTLQIIKSDITESYRVTELTKDMLRIAPIEP
ncbi:MAG: hypothetical protein A2471_04955 [Omnitrophica WOR_2 bacterium RIFOXYC2_FULL_45_15]|nr:MAG: hypothetical protein A2471_04955 [Omnitrophica WOR_2 bacterium RIFOXYC2_FULL_45_15]HBU08300.1 hypothetical protein [Candidatus Omnitrophota bacterium]